MSISAPFIARPVGTTLLTLAVALVGMVAYVLLPVAPLPQVDFATIMVQANMPGASPETMAYTVATPLERALGRIAGVTEMTSSSSQGNTRIVLQFDLDRDIDGAARDVQAAINASRAMLPAMPRNPTYRKVNPADAPIMVMGITSDSLTLGELYDIASNVFSQKISQVYGVGQVSVSGASLPAVRVAINPGALQSRGISLEDARAAIAESNANLPKGMLEDGERHWFIGANDQLLTAEEYAPVIIRHKNGAYLRLSDVAEVSDDVEDTRNAGFIDGKQAVMVIIFKQSGANVIETVSRIRQALPTLRAWLPESADFTVMMDRSPSIAASVKEVENTMVISMGLVILVVFLFLRNGRATFIPAVAVPVSLLGTFGIMYLFNFSLNHLSLMALTVATGFVVDDAIVVTENIVRHMENGTPPREAALLGSREVAFTVVSISFSLVAIFIPILGMGGIPGRLFKEFAVALSAAVLVSLVVSLVVTPMMCAHILKRGDEDRPPCPSAAFMGGVCGALGRVYARVLRFWGDFMDWLHESYARTLAVVLRHKGLTLLVLLATIGCNIYLYIIVPKDFFPGQDVGQILGRLRGDQSVSFQAMLPKTVQLMEIVRAHPAVQSVGGYTGGGSRNSGSVFINLKPRKVRKQTAVEVINDLRKKLAVVPGGELVLVPMQDLRMGGRQTSAAYQYTLQSDDLALLRHWTPIITRELQAIPGLVDVSSDQETRGLQTTVVVDRNVISRLGITQKQVDAALGLAFGQTFVSTIYTGANQYRVAMAFSPEYLEGPEGLFHLYVPAGRTTAAAIAGTGLSGNAGSSLSASGDLGASSGLLVPLNAFSRFEPTLTSLSVSHEDQFTAATISFNLLPGYTLSQVQPQIEAVMGSLHVPIAVKGAFRGTAGAFAKAMADQLLLILAAIVTLYIVLGVLYESLIHPLTILSTLPSAGMGAILGLMLFKAEFTIIAFIGVLLLAGIVKKNAIMMIDFALEARRNGNMRAEEAIYKACLLRFRPIMMTTMAAVGGAIPLMLGSGDGAEIRTPLGITIVGGLLVSQLLTLYTTPVVYLFLDRFSDEQKDTKRNRLLAELQRQDQTQTWGSTE